MSARRESTLLNMIIALFVISFVSSGILGFTYLVTKDKIEVERQLEKVRALQKVLPQFDNDPVKGKYARNTDRGEMIFYPATRAGALVGTAVETYSLKGYSGRISLIVGFLPDYSIYNIEVFEHKETPGLGSKIEASRSDFSQQFKGKNPQSYVLKVKKDGGNVDAITAATISSRAFCDAVQSAYNALTTVGSPL